MPLTKKQLKQIEDLKALRGRMWQAGMCQDHEAGHGDADQILCELATILADKNTKELVSEILEYYNDDNFLKW